jgi:oxalate decarboxylase
MAESEISKSKRASSGGKVTDGRSQSVDGKAMTAERYDLIVGALSRRKFFSTALAAAALAGAPSVRAQEKASTLPAEHDQSSSDPGQENKLLRDLNPNSNMPPPTDHGEVIPLWYSFDLVKKRIEEGGWTHQPIQI